MGRPRSQVALAAIALLLGFLLVVQVRAQQAGSGLEAQSSQDLTLLIANRTTRNDALRAELADLGRQLDAMNAARARGETNVGQLRSDLERVRLWSGLEPASGPGIRITIVDPDASVSATAVSDLVNELRNVGAEAIAVGGVRVVAGTVVAGPPGALSVENTALESPIEVAAIGSAPALTGALTRAGGIVAQLQATYPGVAVEVAPLDAVTLPATERTLVPTYGEPRP
jgi:uncharacterized protein YlxW (UPF0749 family)